MDANSYLKNVMVTEARDFSPVKTRLQDENNLRLLHASAGLTSEIAELFELSEKSWNGSETVLDRVNLMEEAGDLLWYIAIAADTLNAPEIMNNVDYTVRLNKHDDDLNDSLYNTAARLSGYAGEIADLTIKKTIFYGKTIDTSLLVKYLTCVHNAVETLLHEAGFTVEQARERNIAKLKARYGDKFTEAAALERNLTAERKILENK